MMCSQLPPLASVYVRDLSLVGHVGMSRVASQVGRKPLVARLPHHGKLEACDTGTVRRVAGVYPPANSSA